MDDLKRLAQQFTQAANIQAPTSYIPEVAKAATASFMAPIVKAGIQAGGALSGEKAKQADEADAQARQAAAQKIKDQMDPSKYQKVRKADGGFAFFDPSGKEIDINNYSKLTGLRRADILKDSENPLDQSYINDYSNMQELASAMYNGDKETIKAFNQQNPSTKNLTPQELASLLIKKYPHIYGKGSYQQTFQNRNQKIFSNNPNAIVGTGSSFTSLGQ